MFKSQNNWDLFDKIRLLSNYKRFKIIELTQESDYSISDLSSKIKLSYTKCADYVTILEKGGLVIKTKEGKETKVRSRVKINQNELSF